MNALRLLGLAAGLTVLSSSTSGASIKNTTSDSLPEVTLNIHTKKWTHLVDERFLSMSVDPEQLIRHSLPGPGALRMLSMATAMSPAYLRVAGHSTEFMGFTGSPSHVGDSLKVNDHQWNQLQTLCSTAGLRPIVALSAHRRPGEATRWDSRDALRVFAAVDASAVAPAGWQLGYDWATLRKAGVTPKQAASDVNTLRSLMEEFPSLAKEPHFLLGPDSDPTTADAEAAADLAKGTNIGAIVIRPFTVEDPTGAKLDKEYVNKALGRGTTKKPLWLAESGGICTAPFWSALLWAQRLCTATRLGAQVVLRELDLDAARDNATPDLWVSLLHKTLTSRGVLEAKGTGPLASQLSVSAHCTPSSKNRESSKTRPISPAIRYDLGAVTVMAANPTDEAISLSLKLSSGSGIGSLLGGSDADVGNMVHEYILTAQNNDLNSTSTLLNGSPLQMAPGGGIPVVSPRQHKMDSPLKVALPPRSIAFWVVPGAKAGACLTSPASSDVAPAASRLRPISARGMEIGVHLDGDSPLPTEEETPREAEEVDNQDADSGESGEHSLVKDLRRRRQKISARPPGTGNARLSLPRIPSYNQPRSRPALDLHLGRASRDQELKTLDDFIRDELRSRPRVRTEIPRLQIPSFRQSETPGFELPKFNIPSIELPRLNVPELPRLNIPELPRLNIPELPTLNVPTLPSLPQLDTSTILDPLKMNTELQQLNSNLQHSLVEQATTPLRNLVKMTDGLLDQVQQNSGSRTARAIDDAARYDEDEERAAIELDDYLRMKRKSVSDYMKEDLNRKHKKAPSEEDVKRPIPRNEESVHRKKRDLPRFAPEDFGLRLKRKPAVPDFLSLPRLPKRPLLSASAKRTPSLLSQNNEETAPNSWGSTHREMFPQGDVYAGTEKEEADQRNPDVDYVIDDDYPVPSAPLAAPTGTKYPGSPARPRQVKQPGLEGDAYYYAPGEFYETLAKPRNAPAKQTPRVTEFGELEFSPGKSALDLDEEADSFKVVPAAVHNKEHEADIQAKLRKRMEEHYADVQRAALDRKAEADSDDDDVPAREETMDMDSLKALAERYRQENKLNVSEVGTGSKNPLTNQAEAKESGKEESGQKSRRRRDIEQSNSHPKVGNVQTSQNNGHALKKNEEAPVKMDASVVTTPTTAGDTKHQPERKHPVLPSLKQESNIQRLASSPGVHTPEELKERSIEKIRNFKEKMSEGKTHSHFGKPGHDSHREDSTRRKRSLDFDDIFDNFSDYVLRQLNSPPKPDPPSLWDSTGDPAKFSSNADPKQEELWPFPRSSGSYGGMSNMNRRRPYSQGFGYPSQGYGPYGSHGFGSYPSFGVSDSSEECNSDESQSHYGHIPDAHHRNQHRYFGRSSFDLNPFSFDFPESQEIVIEDFSVEARTTSAEEPQPSRLPSIVSIPWDVSLPDSKRVKRAIDNTIVQSKPAAESPDDLAAAIRNLHKILNEDSSEESSVEVNHNGRVIDSTETVDSLEETIQALLNMTKHLNETLKREGEEEMISWSDFDLDDFHPEDPKLDAEEMKFRDAALAWIEGAKTGIIRVPTSDETDQTSHHLSVKKQLDDETPNSAAKELERQKHLTEQQNIVTAMMQRASVLLSELRTILNKKVNQ